MNAKMAFAMMKLHVLIQEDRLSARVMTDTPEMASFAMV